MKNMRFIVIILFIITFFFTVYTGTTFANTSLTGPYGYFTIPITETPAKGNINLSSGYIFSPGNFYFSVNTSIIDRWEFSLGKEILVSEGSDIGSTPFIIGTKFMFYKKGGFRVSTGVGVELSGESAEIDGTPFKIYGVISESAGKIGYINTGLGYTLGINAGYSLNFFFGLNKALIDDKLYAIGEFTNYSVRHGMGLPWDEGRGIFNGGLLLVLTDFLRFKFIAYDLFDNFLTVGLGGEIRIKAF